MTLQSDSDITGCIRHDGNFYAADGAERWFVEVRKSKASALPYVDGKRVSVDLSINGVHYTAGIRTTPKIAYISYDLYDKNDEKLRLVDALIGFGRNEKVTLRVKDKDVELTRHSAAHPIQEFSARRRVVQTLKSELTKAETAVTETNAFDPKSIEDGRTTALRAVVARRGQSKFRSQLLVIYKGLCAVTGCDLPEALEAAHICPYMGQETHHITNGILLRADIHTLFDLGLITVNSETYEVVVSPELLHSVYAELSGKKLHLPEKQSLWPSKVALSAHREWAAL